MRTPGFRRGRISKKMVDVAPGLRDVRGIDEQHIAAFERIEHARWHVLHLRFDQLDADFRKEGPRIRLDRGDAACAAEKAARDVGHQERRVTGANLDDARRPPLAQQHERCARVEPAELRIADVERRQLIVRRAFFGVIEVGIETREQCSEHVPVRRIVELDAGDFGRRIGPDARRIRARIGRIDDRRIEMAARMRRADFRRRVAVNDDRRRLASADRVRDELEPLAQCHGGIRPRGARVQRSNLMPCANGSASE
jgi:hypothetical protein